jgi:hypothetical protein
MKKQEKKNAKERGNGRMKWWQGSKTRHQVTLIKMQVAG